MSREPAPEPIVLTSARPALRLVPPPAEQLPLDLEWEVSPGVPAVPPVPAFLRVVGSADAGQPELADPRRWVAQLARAVSEVLIGARPAAQLTRWVARDQLGRLAARAAARQRHPSSRGRTTPPPRTVRAVRLCPVAPGVIEASAVVIGGERAHAVALRLEAVEGRWLATVVDLR